MLVLKLYIYFFTLFYFQGNNFFKAGNYDSAINSYTTGLLLDPENPLLAANRAMAFLKKEQ